MEKLANNENSAKGLNRQAIGFELSKNAFEYQHEEIDKLDVGYLKNTLRQPPENIYFNQGKPLQDDEKQSIVDDYADLVSNGHTKKKAIDQLSEKYGRGYWSLLRVIDGTTNKSVDKQDLF